MIRCIGTALIISAQYLHVDRWAKQTILIPLALIGCFLGLGEAISGDDQGANSIMRSFDYNGISIKYTDEGSGRQFIFLHGFGASS